MSDGEVWGTKQSLTMKCPLVTWKQQKYFFFFLYCAWLQPKSLAHIFKAKELKSKPETKSAADKALIWKHWIESVQKDIETIFCDLHAVIKHNRPIYESCIVLISIRPGIWWCFKKRSAVRRKIYIRSGMFSFGLANFLSLSDRMSDMLKKFSTSLGDNWPVASRVHPLIVHGYPLWSIRVVLHGQTHTRNHGPGNHRTDSDRELSEGKGPWSIVPLSWKMAKIFQLN